MEDRECLMPKSERDSYWRSKDRQICIDEQIKRDRARSWIERIKDRCAVKAKYVEGEKEGNMMSKDTVQVINKVKMLIK